VLDQLVGSITQFNNTALQPRMPLSKTPRLQN
jgi:hypothetical protein